MPISFQPSRFGIVVISKWTSASGRWIIFYGTHFSDKGICYDVGQFNTQHGATQRLHFSDNKTGAIVAYDEIKAELTKLGKRQAEGRGTEPAERFQIFGPDGKRAN